MSNPGKEHWDTVKWIMWYLKGTSNHGIIYGRAKLFESQLVGYEDFVFTGDLDGGNSISVYLFLC